MKTKILNIGIEPLEERYSTQWDRWFKREFQNADLDITTVYGTEITSGKIGNGSFLDVVETNIYKNNQLHWILRYLQTYDDSYKLVLFFHDLWNPALTSVAYVRDGLGLKNLKICGCLHAGSYDKFDFLNKQGMTPWAHPIEYGWFNGIVDKIFVATEYHKQLLIKTRVDNNPKERIVVTGFPLYDDFSNVDPINPITTDDLDPIIVFPHRLDSEKNPQLFNKLALEFTNCHFIKSKETCQTKESYYRLLKTADIAVSFADQETWGIAMQEAVLCGCLPVLPNRLSYTEMYPKCFLYNTFEECVTLVQEMASNSGKYEEEGFFLKSEILRKGREAIPNMIKEMQKL